MPIYYYGKKIVKEYAAFSLLASIYVKCYCEKMYDRSEKLFKTYIDFAIHGQGDHYSIKSAYNTVPRFVCIIRLI